MSTGSGAVIRKEEGAGDREQFLIMEAKEYIGRRRPPDLQCSDQRGAEGTDHGRKDSLKLCDASLSPRRAQSFLA
jgi:hypothetical protein